MVLFLTPVIFANAALLLLICGIYAWQMHRSSWLNGMLSILCLLLAIGNFGQAVANATTSKAVCIACYHISWIGWAFYPAVALHVTLLLTEYMRHTRRVILLLVYVPACLIFFRSQVDLLGISDFYPTVAGTYLPHYSYTLWDTIYPVYQYGFDALAMGIIAHWGIVSASRRKRIQAGVILAASFIAIVCDAIHYWAGKQGELSGLWAIEHLIFAAGITYAVTRHKFVTPTTALASGSIVEHIRDLVLLSTLDGVILQANAMAQTLLRYPSEALVGKRIDALFAPGQENDIALCHARDVASMLPREMTMQTASGTPIPVEMVCTPLRDQYQDTIGLVIIARDLRQTKQLRHEIAERVHAEDALRLAHNSLEAEVERRTEELALTNAQLREEVEERQQAQLAQQQHYAFLQQIIDTIPNPLVCKDRDRRFIMCNRAFSEAVGISQEMILGKMVSEVTAPEYAAIADAKDITLQETGENQIYEVPLIFADGIRHQMVMHKAVIRRDDGTVDGIVGVMLDITNGRRAEEALRTSEQYYRTIFESIQDVFFRADLDGTILLVSPSIETLFGYVPEELIGRNAREFIGDPNRFVEFLAQLLPTGNLRNFEAEMITQDGRLVCVAYNARLVDGEDGRPKYIEGIFRDITAWKTVEEALRSSQEMLAQAQMIAGIGSWNLDLQSNAVTLSDQTYRLFGYEPQQFEPTYEAIMRHIYADDREGLITAMRGAQATRRALRHEFRICRADGEVRYVLAQAEVLYDENNAAYFFVGTLLDVTDRKHAEETILRYEGELRALALELHLAQEKERRRLAEDLHDHVCQPLVLANMQLQAHRHLAKETCPASETLADICRGIERLIKQVYSLTFELSPPVLHELGFDAAIEWLTEQFEQNHGIAVVVERPGSSPTLNSEMAIVLFRMVQECLTNIVKHARARHVSISILGTGDVMQIDVTDDGVGFNPAEMHRPQTGGFGLFSMQERLRYFGGRVVIDSSPGVGTSVSLIMPLATRESTREVTV